MLPHANAPTHFPSLLLPCLWCPNIQQWAFSSLHNVSKHNKTLIARAESHLQQDSRRSKLSVNGMLEPIVKNLAAIAMTASLWSAASDAEALTSLQQSIRSDIPVVGCYPSSYSSTHFQRQLQVGGVVIWTEEECGPVAGSCESCAIWTRAGAGRETEEFRAVSTGTKLPPALLPPYL